MPTRFFNNEETLAIMCNYEAEELTPDVSYDVKDYTEDDIIQTEEEKEVARYMLRELWYHRQEGRAGWYYKDFLFDDYLDYTVEDSHFAQLQEKVYNRLVDIGAIEVLSSDESRCILGKNASIYLSIEY